MIINHNMNAMNAHRLMGTNTVQAGKSMEKLSSGLRINRAGDDAAGLAISEKMRGQIRGLDQAGRNSQDGISMIQTAEGALNETHSILQRMRELAVQASNDTNTESDRGEMQKEINQLSSEINRIAGTTEFNKQTLLDGGLAADAVTGADIDIIKSGQNSKQATFEIVFSAFDESNTGLCGICISVNGSGVQITNCGVLACTLAGRIAVLAEHINMCSPGACFTATSVGNKLILTSKMTEGEDPVAINGCTIVNVTCSTCATISTQSQTVDGTCGVASKKYFSATDDLVKEGVRIDIGGRSFALWDSSAGNYESCADFILKNNLGTCVTIIDINCASSDEADELLACIASCTTFDGESNVGWDSVNKRICIESACLGVDSNNDTNVKVYGLEGTAVTSDNGTKLQIGANAGQSFTVTFSNMAAEAIGITGENAGDEITASNGKKAYLTSTMDIEKDGKASQFALDVSSADKASAAISVLDDAIGKVSAERSKLGAYQNRLEHTIANLGTSSENLTAAESRIRDVDMAKEMMSFQKNNILQQAAQAMLAQANQAPQGVLQLLR